MNSHTNPTPRMCLSSVLAALLALPVAAGAQNFADDTLPAAAAGQLLRLEPGQSASIILQSQDLARGSTAAWTLRRIEVYADDAQLWVMGPKGRVPSPRSLQRHYVGYRSGHERIALSLAPDGHFGEGLLLDEEGSWSLSLTPDTAGAQWQRRATEAKTPDGHQPSSDCFGGLDSPPAPLQNLHLQAAATPDAVQVATRKVTLAIDTDNELMQQKFANDATAASNYLAALVTQMSAIYEQDSAAGGGQIKLEIGTQILRPSTTTDPYPSAVGGDQVAQLNEFGAFWMGNYPYATYPRAFALMISGKSSNANSAAGIAWLITSGSYCAATGQNFGGQTFGHYSVSRVFKFAGSNASHDVILVAHELGHNFGLAHTHCTDTSGNQPRATSTLDQCFAGEAGAGCYSGATSCPSSGPGAPKGTLMSYCHVNGCGSPNVGAVHPVQVTVLNNRIASQPSSCVVPINSNNQPPTITAPSSLSVTEDVSSALTGISFTDPDAGNGSLTATFSVASGSVSATSSAGVTVGGSSTARTLNGSLTNLNAFIAASKLSYTTALNATAPVSLTVNVNDNGNTGSGGAQSDTETVSLIVNAVNDSPSVAAPASITVTEDVPTAVTGIVFSDLDAGSGNLTAIFSVASGSVSATSSAGVTVGGSSTALTLNGSLTNLNAFIAASKLSYTTASNATTAVILTVTLNDNGNTGSGGAQSGSAAIGINVSAVNDAPSVAAPAQRLLPSTGVSAVSGISFSDVDAASGSLSVTLSAPPLIAVAGTDSGGVTTSGSGSTRNFQGTLSNLNAYFGGGQATLVTTGFIGPGNLSIDINDNGNTGSGGAKNANATITLHGILYADGFE